MDFAKNHLKSLGWKEGTGLGKTQNGIKTAIKPKLKFDNHGIGYELTDNCNQWWNQAFNCAAIGHQFKLAQTQNGIRLKNKSNKTNSHSNQAKNNYSNFVRSESDVNNNNIDMNCNDFEFENNSNERTDDVLDFDELFRRSEGRTGHKAARIGHKMDGKLRRLEEQDKDYMNKIKKLKKN